MKAKIKRSWLLTKTSECRILAHKHQFSHHSIMKKTVECGSPLSTHLNQANSNIKLSSIVLKTTCSSKVPHNRQLKPQVFLQSKKCLDQSSTIHLQIISPERLFRLQAISSGRPWATQCRHSLKLAGRPTLVSWAIMAEALLIVLMTTMISDSPNLNQLK